MKQGPATSAKEFGTVDITSVVGDFEAEGMYFEEWREFNFSMSQGRIFQGKVEKKHV